LVLGGAKKLIKLLGIYHYIENKLIMSPTTEKYKDFLTGKRYPTVYPTVDIGVYDYKAKRVLLGRKPTQEKFRFPGGFTDPTDDSYELAALRELYEETGLTVGLDGLRYIGSEKINDSRYRDNPFEKIITHLYLGFYSFGAPVASDDLAETRWFSLDEITEKHDDIFVSEHISLARKFVNYIKENKL
jgi:bifunctional NMN adenylyltransferase/nudix hydrolase